MTMFDYLAYIEYNIDEESSSIAPALPTEAKRKKICEFLGTLLTVPEGGSEESHNWMNMRIEDSMFLPVGADGSQAPDDNGNVTDVYSRFSYTPVAKKQQQQQRGRRAAAAAGDAPAAAK